MGKTSYTREITKDQANALEKLLRAEGFEFREKEYAMFSAGREKLNVTVYEKGPKILVQGKDTESFVQFRLEPEILGVAELGYEEVNHPEMFQPHFGIDESGKGDLFGPLVVAGVYVNADIARALIDSGITDSKKITSDAKIRKLAQTIRDTPGVVGEVFSMGPEKYNALYEKFGNLNKLLAWGHARVIEGLARKCPHCPRALSDQFANSWVLESALKKRGCTIELEQRTKAEADVAVAAASILARERFVDWLKECSEKLGFELPKGVSEAVRAAGKRFLEEKGQSSLHLVAKTHFKTAQQL